ncbi:hypothetical protein E4U45_008519 [Claviceps purpurea]|nr:hypothetical protein E4U45_008519 [Claviceps purpurea]
MSSPCPPHTSSTPSDRGPYSRPQRRLELPGKGAETDNIAQAFLGKHLEDPDRDYMVRRHVISKLANTLDEFANVFSDTNNVLAKHTSNKAPQSTVASNIILPSRSKGNQARHALLLGLSKDITGVRTNDGEFVQRVGGLRNDVLPDHVIAVRVVEMLAQESLGYIGCSSAALSGKLQAFLEPYSRPSVA